MPKTLSLLAVLKKIDTKGLKSLSDPQWNTFLASDTEPNEIQEKIKKLEGIEEKGGAYDATGELIVEDNNAMIERFRQRTGRAKGRESLKVKKSKINVKSFKEDFLNKKEEETVVDKSQNPPINFDSDSPPTPTLSKPDPVEEKETEGLKGIRGVLDDILKVLRLDFKGDRKQARNEQKEAAQDKRDKRESKLEGGVKKSLGVIGNAVGAMMKPFTSIWESIINWIKFTLIGVLFQKTLKWFSDPKNKKKAERVGKFFKDWWPALAGAAALFLTPLGALISGMTGLLMAIIPKLVMAIAANPWAAAAVLGGVAIWGISKRIGGKDKSESEEGETVELDTTVAHGGGLIKSPPISNYNEGGEVVDTTTPISNYNEGGLVHHFNKGGLVQHFKDGGSPQPTEDTQEGQPTPADFGLPDDFDFDKPEHRELLVDVLTPHMKKFVQDQNAAVDDNPEAFQGIKLEMDRDGRMPNFGKFVAAMSEEAFNNSLALVQSNQSLEDIPEAQGAILGMMMEIRKEIGDNPNWKGDMAFDIKEDIPGTAAYRLLMDAQQNQTGVAAKSGAFSPEQIALLRNRRNMSGGGVVHQFGPQMGSFFGGGGLVQYLNNGGRVGYGMGMIMPDQFVYNKQEFTSTFKTKGGEVIEDTSTFTDIGGAIGMPDLQEHQTQLVDSLRQVPGYEDINFMDVIQYPDGKGRLVGMPEETLYPILNASDAAQATNAKIEAGNQKFMADNDLINPDGSVKGYSYMDGKITVDGETRDAVLGDGAIKKFNKGGEVPGTGNKDTVPAMLTPGEFVMSKGAVQKYGSDTMESMNAASAASPSAGSKKNGTVPAMLTPGEFVVSAPAVQEFGVKTLESMNLKGGGNNKPELKAPDENVTANKGGLIRQYLQGGGEVKPQGWKRWLAGAADVMTGGLTDFDKRGSMMDGVKRLTSKEPVETPVPAAKNRVVTLPPVSAGQKGGEDVIPAKSKTEIPQFRVPMISNQRNMVVSSLGISDLMGGA
jgi:hypothetical protein